MTGLLQAINIDLGKARIKNNKPMEYDLEVAHYFSHNHKPVLEKDALRNRLCDRRKLWFSYDRRLSWEDERLLVLDVLDVFLEKFLE